MGKHLEECIRLERNIPLQTEPLNVANFPRAIRILALESQVRCVKGEFVPMSGKKVVDDPGILSVEIKRLRNVGIDKSKPESCVQFVGYGL